MTLLHSGGSKGYGDNWARAFGEPEKASSKKKTVAKSHGSPMKKASNKKVAAKQSAKKKK